MENEKRRTIGLHPCVGKKASGEERPTTIVIRTSDGKHTTYEFDEQQLLDFFTCGAVVAWRNAILEDPTSNHTPHHLRWSKIDAKTYEETHPDERGGIFRVLRKNSTGEITDYLRLQVGAELVVLHPATDIIGVANGGLGYQIIELLLGRYPEADMRVIGSGTLKEQRPKFDELLPTTIRRKAERIRVESTKDVSVTEALESDDGDGEDDEPISKSAAKDANAKFDAHRIAYALAHDATARIFHRCTLRDRDWAAVNIAYGQLEAARKARVAAEQQFRQIHRTELRRLVKNPLVPYVTLGGGDEDDQRIDALLAAYEATLRICVTNEKEVAKKKAVLRQAYARIEGARVTEKEMDGHLEDALGALPEYTEFLPYAKAQVHPETGLPLGKYIGDRIFGRWIAGFGSPMSTRINEPMRQSDIDRIATCKQALTRAIESLERTGLPTQPPSDGGQTREWLLACERVARARIERGLSAEQQLAHILTCRDAYRKLVNAQKSAKHRPRNRVIAYMGLHVKQGGKYAGTAKDHEFPRRRKGGRANWNERLLRQGSYQWVTLIIKGGDSHWKVHVYVPTKAKRIAAGEKRGAAHKDASWRTATVAVRWFIDLWFRWERRRAQAESGSVDQAA